MRFSRVFRLAGVLSLLGMAALVVTAGLTAAVGVAALSGRVAYPYAVELGPLRATWRVTLPVAAAGAVCQQASVSDQGPSECYRFFVHEEDDAGSRETRRQDADIQPSEVILAGHADLTSTPGWSPYVAAFVLKQTVTMLAVAALLYLLGRTLWATGGGNAFTRPTIRRLRLMAALVLAAALTAPVLGGLARTDVLGYWFESFGVYPGLVPSPDLSWSLGQIATALVLLLVVEVAWHGVALEDEARVTV